MQPEGEQIRVLIADDHPVVRRGMSSLLASLAGVTVVGEAADGAAAIREAQLTRPDVVVMDLQMPSMDGVEATRRLAAAVPATAVLVLTMFEDDETVLSAMRAGARGYLLKGAGSGGDPGRTAVRGGRPARDRARGGRPAGGAPDRRGSAAGAVPRADAAGAGDPRPDRPGATNTAIATGWSWRPRQSATTSRRSSPSCGWAAGPRRSRARAHAEGAPVAASRRGGATAGRRADDALPGSVGGAATVGATLAAAALLSLWLAPPTGDRLSLMIWVLVLGAGFAAAGAVVAWNRPRPARRPVRRRRPALLLAAPLARRPAADRRVSRPGRGGRRGGATARPARRRPPGAAVLAPARCEAWSWGLRGGHHAVRGGRHGPGLVTCVLGGVAASSAPGGCSSSSPPAEQRRQVLWLVLGVLHQRPGDGADLLGPRAPRHGGAARARRGRVLRCCSRCAPAIAVLAPGRGRRPAGDQPVGGDRRDARLWWLRCSSARWRPRGLAAGGAPPSGCSGCWPPDRRRLPPGAGAGPGQLMDEMLFGGRPDAVRDADPARQPAHRGRAAAGVAGHAARGAGGPGGGAAPGRRCGGLPGELAGAPRDLTPLRVGSEEVGELAVALPRRTAAPAAHHQGGARAGGPAAGPGAARGRLSDPAAGVPAAGWWPRWRRSAAGCAATCTTGSARP